MHPRPWPADLQHHRPHIGVEHANASRKHRTADRVRFVAAENEKQRVSCFHRTYKGRARRGLPMPPSSCVGRLRAASQHFRRSGRRRYPSARLARRAAVSCRSATPPIPRLRKGPSRPPSLSRSSKTLAASNCARCFRWRSSINRPAARPRRVTRSRPLWRVCVNTGVSRNRRGIEIDDHNRSERAIVRSCDVAYRSAALPPCRPDRYRLSEQRPALRQGETCRRLARLRVRVFVTGDPPNCSGPGMPHRAITNSRPSRLLRMIGANRLGKMPGNSDRLPVRSCLARKQSRIAARPLVKE